MRVLYPKHPCFGQGSARSWKLRVHCTESIPATGGGLHSRSWKLRAHCTESIPTLARGVCPKLEASGTLKHHCFRQRAQPEARSFGYIKALLLSPASSARSWKLRVHCYHPKSTNETLCLPRVPCIYNS